MLYAVAQKGDVKGAIAFCSSVVKVVKTLHASAGKNGIVLEPDEVVSGLHRMVSNSGHWLRENTGLDPDTDIADALHSTCQTIAEEMSPTKEGSPE